MAHKIDLSKGRAAFVAFAAPAWHGLGVTMTEAISAQDALIKGGLDFAVTKLPNIHRLPNGEEIISEDSFFTFREDVQKVLGTRLGKDYTVLQNAEALNVVDEILQSGTATIETAGAIDNGKRVFICLKVQKPIIVGSNDSIEQYVLIANAHDGTMSVIAMETNIRVVCNNTLSAALRGSQAKIKIRHTANAAERLQEAAKILNLIQTNTATNEDNYNTMLNTIITPEQMFNYFGNIFCTKDEIKALQSGLKTDEVISTRKKNILTEVVQFANNGIGQSMTLNRGNLTMWTAYNAITGYATRKRYRSADDRANSMLFGSSAELIQDAGELALEPSKIEPLHMVSAGFNLN